MDPVKLPSKKVEFDDDNLHLPCREVGFRPTLFDKEHEHDIRLAQKGVFRAMILPAIKNNFSTTLCAFLTLTALVGAGIVTGKKDPLMPSYMLNFRIFFSCLTVGSLGVSAYAEDTELVNRKARKELKLLEAQLEEL